ncbi:MAG TPA: phospholipase D-like domain-containing protein [Candidatus Nitrosotalea sp.]|nr:phospholipase D-like domain-containing protein [Candidatus Nitrosotalea sp.]
MTDVQILATGPEFIGEGVRGTGPVIEEIIGDAQNEIQILAYLFTTSGRVLSLLESSLRKGIRVTIVINEFEKQNDDIKEKITALINEFSHLKVVNFHKDGGEQLHAKVVVVDRKKAIVGSANFSWGGMTRNYEIGILLEGEGAWKLGKLVDDLTS